MGEITGCNAACRKGLRQWGRDGCDHRRYPLSSMRQCSRRTIGLLPPLRRKTAPGNLLSPARTAGDRKSTRLNSSHVKISYAVFCLKKKKEVAPVPVLRGGRER